MNRIRWIFLSPVIQDPISTVNLSVPFMLRDLRMRIIHSAKSTLTHSRYKKPKESIVQLFEKLARPRNLGAHSSHHCIWPTKTVDHWLGILIQNGLLTYLTNGSVGEATWRRLPKKVGAVRQCISRTKAQSLQDTHRLSFTRRSMCHNAILFYICKVKLFGKSRYTKACTRYHQVYVVGLLGLQSVPASRTHGTIVASWSNVLVSSGLLTWWTLNNVTTARRNGTYSPYRELFGAFSASPEFASFLLNKQWCSQNINDTFWLEMSWSWELWLALPGCVHKRYAWSK